MRRTRRAFRLFALCAAVFQLGLPPLVAVADAIVQRTDGQASMVHVEDHSHTNCRPGHPADCVLCQTLAHWSAPLPHDDARLGDAGRAPMAPVAAVASVRRIAYRTPHSRGPPA